MAPRRYGRVAAIIQVKGIKINSLSPLYPVSHPFVERLIGMVRRGFLDHIFFWYADDMQQKLNALQHYYNYQRVHTSLGGIPPVKNIRDHLALGRFRWKPCCHGLYELPIAA